MSERGTRERLGARVTARLALLGASLRAGGVRVGVGEVLAAHRALAAVDAASPAESYYALRATFCSRFEDLEVFDAVFHDSFGHGRAVQPPALDEAGKVVLPRVAAGGEGPGRALAGGDAEVVPAAASDVELLRDKDFAGYSDDERATARALIARLALRGPTRLGRRTRPARRRGETHDLRATLRASLRYGGEPIDRRWRRRVEQARPLVFVLDVSGSMEPYARMLLQYVQAAVAARPRVEAFVFGTRLTRVTRELRGRDPDRALERAARAVADWSGGTRIGAALAALNREHGRRLGRGAVVVILSDGWDRGDPELLAAEMARLRRSAWAIVWLNPLKAQPGYEPLVRGMRAALPYVDHFLAGNSIRSLEELADVLETGLRPATRGGTR